MTRLKFLDSDEMFKLMSLLFSFIKFRLWAVTLSFVVPLQFLWVKGANVACNFGLEYVLRIQVFKLYRFF